MKKRYWVIGMSGAAWFSACGHLIGGSVGYISYGIGSLFYAFLIIVFLYEGGIMDIKEKVEV